MPQEYKIQYTVIKVFSLPHMQHSPVQSLSCRHTQFLLRHFYGSLITYVPTIFYGKIHLVEFTIKLLLLMKSTPVMVSAVDWDDIVKRNPLHPSESEELTSINSSVSVIGAGNV
jgi:hypothetical protein